MPNLSIKNVPAALVEELHERAARQHRSMQGELMAIIQAALTSTPSGAERETPGHRSGTRRIEEIAAEHRVRHRKAVAVGESAADLIRADRDAR